MASKERYIIIPGSNFALKQPLYSPEKTKREVVTRARKRFPGYFSKELPHASWDEVITDWWAKMTPHQRGDALAIHDSEVMQGIALINNHLLYQGILLSSGVVRSAQNRSPRGGLS